MTEALKRHGPEELHLRMIQFESKCGSLAIQDGCYDPTSEDDPLLAETSHGGFVKYERLENGRMKVTFLDAPIC